MPYKALERIKFSTDETAPETKNDPETSGENLIWLPQNRSQDRSQNRSQRSQNRSQPFPAVPAVPTVPKPEIQHWNDIGTFQINERNDVNDAKTALEANIIWERERNRERAKELKSIGCSLAKIASELNISKTQAHRLINGR